jgi:transcriptional regulator with XRE-family HTH domain
MTDLRALLSAHGMPQRQAARILGVNPRTVRRWCAGKIPVPTEVLGRLRKRLRISA